MPRRCSTIRSASGVAALGIEIAAAGAEQLQHRDQAGRQLGVAGHGGGRLLAGVVTAARTMNSSTVVPSGRGWNGSAARPARGPGRIAHPARGRARGRRRPGGRGPGRAAASDRTGATGVPPLRASTAALKVGADEASVARLPSSGMRTHTVPAAWSPSRLLREDAIATNPPSTYSAGRKSIGRIRLRIADSRQPIGAAVVGDHVDARAPACPASARRAGLRARGSRRTARRGDDDQDAGHSDHVRPQMPPRDRHRHAADDDSDQDGSRSACASSRVPTPAMSCPTTTRSGVVVSCDQLNSLGLRYRSSR